MKKFIKKVILPITTAILLSQVAYAQLLPPIPSLPPPPTPSSEPPVPPLVTLTPSSTSVLQGDSFYIDVFADLVIETDQVIAFGFDVITPTGIGFKEAIIRSGFTDNSDNLPDTDVAGHKFIGVSSGDVLLATLKFDVTSAELGDYMINVESDLADLNEGLFTFPIPIPLLKFEIDASTYVSVVPEPSTLLMTMLGFAGLGVVAVRMRKENRV